MLAAAAPDFILVHVALKGLHPCGNRHNISIGLLHSGKELRLIACCILEGLAAAALRYTAGGQSIASSKIELAAALLLQQSFTRREKALSLIANLKASAVGLYFMHRDCE